MKKLAFLLALLFVVPSAVQAQKKKKRKKQIVLIETSFGDIKLKLFDETPKHKENFLKLVEEGSYDSTLFHRVISDFMIQGGDPDSKKAAARVALGNGELGYTIPAEFVDSLFHKKGALAAARLSDDVNPKQESSSCQFYIVHGRKFSKTDLQMMEKQMNNRIKNGLYLSFFDNIENVSYRKRFLEFQKSKDQQAYGDLMKEIEPLIESDFIEKKFAFSEAQIEAYSSVGGAPHLDGAYTVFGEVIEGLEVIDKIAAQETDPANRPKKDVRIQMKLVKR